MSKKYLSLEEAARLLAVSPDELVRLRERGEIRGFADRGTWKFKQEDVESLARRRQADSSPEVPLFGDDLAETSAMNLSDELDLEARKGDDHLLFDDEDESPTQSDSDSDVRLVGGPDLDLDLDSDSDVKLVGLDGGDPFIVGEGTDPELQLRNPDSDSDVKLVRPDSDSDVKLAGESDSDSDVKLVGGESSAELTLVPGDSTEQDLAMPDSFKSSDSDIKLSPPGQSGDVSLLKDDDDAIPIDLGDESGISLGGDSSLLLGMESGISLEGPTDSGIALDEDEDDEGITLALEGDSGISLDTGDSGISLESADSGISLENFGGTVPMMDAVSKGGEDETAYEIPALEDDSAFDMKFDNDETGVLDVQESGLDDAVFDVDEAEEEVDEFADPDELDLEADAFEEDEDLDVFEGDEAFDDMGERQYAPQAGRMAAESDWGTGTFVGLVLATVLMLVCGSVMIDLIKNPATASTPNPVSGFILDSLGGMYK